MINLAGVPDCDRYIRRELTRCGIEIVELDKPANREVPARLTGKLGAFTFSRAWYYWCAAGPMPLVVARELYAHPIGKTDIRVAGDCGCPPPDEWVTHRDADGKELVHDPDGKQLRECVAMAERLSSMRKLMLEQRFVPDAAAVAATSTVDSYHIDSELGMYLFAQAVRRLEAA